MITKNRPRLALKEGFELALKRALKPAMKPAIKPRIAPTTALTSLLFGLLFAWPMAGFADDGVDGLSAPSTGSFPNPALKGWQERSFVGNTQYEIVDAGTEKVLKGVANGTASVLYNKRKVNVGKTPWVNWSWQVEETLGPINEQTQAGDDFAGRLYVVVRTGYLPWQTTAINYVWSSSTDIGTHWANPFTKKSVMVALRSGDEETGQWHHERRNVVDDFKRFFNLDIKKIDGYAVMVDTDNTGKQATAYFGNISFTAE